MADTDERLDITPRVIETGSQVIQLSQVTSAGYGTSHPFRPVGLVLIALAVVLLGTEFARGGVAAFAPSRAGSPMLWIAFAAAGVGLFLTVFAKRSLVIRTTDGARTFLPAGDEDTAALILGRIRSAFEAAGTLPSIAHAPATGITSKSTPPVAIASESPAQLPTATPERSLPIANQSQAAHATPRQAPALSAGQTQPLAHGRRPEAYVNGRDHAAGVTDPFHPTSTEPDEQRRQHPPHYLPPRHAADRAGPGAANLPTVAAQRDPVPFEDLAQARPRREPQPPAVTEPPAPPRDTPADDLHALIEHVRRADLQHKEALLDLLRVVDDHYRGQANREDAQAHWRSFADYVMQYLSDVDGLLDMTERFGRHMVAR